MKYKVGDWVIFEKPLMGITSNDGFILKEVFSKYEVRRINSIDEKNYFVDNFGGEVKVKHKDLESVTRIYYEAVEGEANETTNNGNTIRPGYYEKSSMQPLEVMQRIMTEEQFKGFLLGNCIKYRMRCEQKGQRDSDLYKARQYAYWLEMARDGHLISPSKDKVPFDYDFKVV